ncbi:glycosyltransferase family 2 protein [Clostridium mediterraneense]|uniref:glycosyltransferase family 2 protein n=1 Tax=Clostridium mediterraneense TaxID=1805472 RepID=UPI00082DC3A0|nr:glycosyltransferase family 2 protein [Clostridium mediterraneense]
MKKLLLIVPAFNEEKNLPELVNKINEVQNTMPIKVDTLIINDFSTDNTKEVLKTLKNVNFINLPCNLGIGGAVQTGYKYAKENDYDYAIQIDGDGQHNPKYIKQAYEEIEKGYNFVIGSRFINNQGFQSSFVRRLGINFFYYLIRILTREKITDATSGFRLCDKKVIDLFSRYYPADYPEPETLMILISNGFKVTEIPVIMNEREHGKSSINVVNSIYYMIKVTTAILLSFSLKKKVKN